MSKLRSRMERGSFSAACDRRGDGERLLFRADDFRRCDTGYADRAGRNFRAGAEHSEMERRGRDVRGRQLARLWPFSFDLDGQFLCRASRGSAGRSRLCLGQRRETHYFGAPFGGYKQSGLGSEESFEELLDNTQIKNVNVSLDNPPLPTLARRSKSKEHGRRLIGLSAQGHNLGTSGSNGRACIKRSKSHRAICPIGGREWNFVRCPAGRIHLGDRA